jgi:Dyp-type peroxidase family
VSEPQLQEGIYWDTGQTPGRCAAFLFLRATPGVPAREVGQVLQRIYDAQAALAAGRVGDLPGTALPDGFRFTRLVGYGQKAFALPGARRMAPQALLPFSSPLTGGGGPIVRGAGLHYAPGLQRNPATEEVLFQFIGDTPLSVQLPVVETWKVLHDSAQNASEAPLTMAACFSGFGREDRRSWIDFHDGVSNLRSGQERKRVIACKVASSSPDAWLNEGTYVAFVKIRVDLAAWRQLPRLLQEELVGRDKLTGCALVDGSRETGWNAIAGCPFAGGSLSAPGGEAFLEPSGVAQGAIKLSHVRRANHGRQNHSDPDSNRIFRQGFEFLDGVASGAAPDLGLNFVSFQDTPRRLVNLLNLESWLGKINFGGDENAPMPSGERLLHALAAGIYAVPPAGVERFPGASIFLES